MGSLVCLGEIVVDCFADSMASVEEAAEDALPPKSRVGVETVRWTQLPGGAPANVTCALAKFGHKVDFVGSVGQDSWGKALVQMLSDMGVGTGGVQYRQKAPTREVYLLKDEMGAARFVRFNREQPGQFADARLFADALPEPMFADADCVVIGSISMAYPDSYEAVQRSLAVAAEHRVPVMMNVNWQSMFWPKPGEAPGKIYDALPQVSYLQVSEDEADWLFGTVSASAIASQLPHLKGVLVTAGEQGCCYTFGEVSGYVSGFSVEVEDKTGAGDAFCAGFLHQLLKKGTDSLFDEITARDMVAYASAVAALTTTRPGAIAGLPTPSEVEAFLYLHQ